MFRKQKKFLASLLSLTLLITSVPTQIFANQVEPTSKQQLEMQKDTSGDVKTTTPPAIDLKLGKYVGEGYEVELRVTSKWEGTFGGELKITNTSDKPLENWTLKFDLEHEIKNMWNAKIVTHEGNSYIVKNADWNQDLAPGSSINIGFEASWDKEIKVPQNYDLLVTKQDVSKEDYAIDFKVTSDWGQAFNGEISITNNTKETIGDWSLEFDFDRNIKSFWEAKIEEHKDNHYVIKNMGYNANIAPGQTIRLGFGGNPGNVTNKPENYILNQIGQEIDYEKDSDGDGLPDWIEKELGTDLNKVDTDEDGLPDGYEYFILVTNPLQQDTDKNGVWDGEEDFDKDILNNLKEYTIGTSPYNDDTDMDVLKDGDEIHKYNTNPILYDTDGDQLGDGDEIELGLNPLLKYTHEGILDSEYIVEQKLGKEVFEQINNSNEYELSLDLKASGYVKNHIVEGESAYSQLIADNRAVLGGVIELSYTEGKIDSGKIHFKIKQSNITHSNVSTELNGIRKYNVFKYFEDDGVLLPVKTYYDEANNTISADTSDLGTYCVMDLEKWIYDLGIQLDTPMSMPSMLSAEDNQLDIISPYYTPVTLSELEAEVNKLEIVSPIFQQSTSRINKPIDLVFVVDTSGSMSGAINQLKITMAQIVTQLYNSGISASVSVVSYNDYGNYGEKECFVIKQNNSNWAYDKHEAIQLINQLSISNGWDEAPLDGLGLANSLIYRKGAQKFTVLITDEVGCLNNRFNYNSISQVANVLNSNSITTCVVTENYLHDYYAPLYKVRGGKYFNIDFNFTSDLIEFIISKTNNQTTYQAVLATGLQTITLDAPLIKDNINRVDTDGDTIVDDKEVNWNLINFDSETATFKLPTIGELMKKKLGYIYDGATLLQEGVNTIPVLPILSDPTRKDSDGDGYNDANIESPIQRFADGDGDDYENLIDPNPLRYDIIRKLDELVKIAQEYTSDKKYQQKLVLQYMRSSTYNGFNWYMTAEAINENFVKFVDKKDPHMKEFFGNGWRFLDPSTYRPVDGAHLAATLNVLVGSGALKNFAWHQSGWAGDLHTFMVMRIRRHHGDYEGEILMYLPDCKNYEEGYNNTLNYLGYVNSSMSEADIYADVDAVNLNAILRDRNIDTVISLYYKDKASIYVQRRFDLFIDNILQRENVSNPVNDREEFKREKFREIVNIYTSRWTKLKDWPIIEDNKLKGAILHDEMRNGVRDGFVEYIWSKRKE